MLNNITNYTNLIDNRKVRTLLEATDLFTVGVRDANFYGNYQPALITTTDLVSSIAGLLPAPITLTTSGSSGPATLIGSTLNIPNYAGGSTLPYWLEYNESDKTVWNNGNGNIATNTSYGHYALNSNTTGSRNSAFGVYALDINTTGSNNTGVGYSALSSTGPGYDNTAVGSLAYTAGYGNYNTAVGSQALLSSGTGGYNTSVGAYSSRFITSGIQNVALGYEALYNTTTGSYNTALGTSSLLNNTTGFFNTALGYGALLNNTSGDGNVALGANSLISNKTGVNNTAIGYGTLALNTIGARNSAYGVFALNSTTTIVSSLGPITPGSGYTDGTYTNIELDYVSGSTCSNRPRVNITVTGGIVTACTLTGSITISYRGTGFKDISTVMTSYLIGPGTGFTISPATLSTGINNIGIGYSTGEYNENGNDNITIGNYALQKSTSSSNMIVIGHNAITTFATFNSSNTIAIGNNITSSNHSGCIILGFGAGASADNQFVVGSAATNAGTVTSEVNASSNVWNVVINGVARKILLA